MRAIERYEVEQHASGNWIVVENRALTGAREKVAGPYLFRADAVWAKGQLETGLRALRRAEARP